MYEYEATLVKVIDGDTVDVNIDLGLETNRRIRVRLFGIDAPEMSTPDRKLAKLFVESWFDRNDGPVRLVTVKDKREKYGRYLAVFHDHNDTQTLNDALVMDGLASEWDGQGSHPAPKHLGDTALLPSGETEQGNGP